MPSLGPALVALLAVMLAALLALAGVLTATGRLTVDVGWGRRSRPLGPLTVRIAAPRDTVFDLASLAYLSARPPRALRDKVEVLERGTDVVIAAHRTRTGPLTTVTVESVAFARPERIAFRLLRGPVPSVAERFDLREAEGGAATELVYSGELATDLGRLGGLWGDLVAHRWERVVADALASLRTSAEAAAARDQPRRSSHSVRGTSGVPRACGPAAPSSDGGAASTTLTARPAPAAAPSDGERSA